MKKNWIGSYRHKVGPGWGRPGWPGQAAGVRQGRAGPGQAKPLGCCPGGWKVKKTWKSEKTWIGSYRQGRPGLAGPGTKTRSAAQAAKSEKKVEK